MENREGLEFLKSKYNLHSQEEVESAEHRTEVRTGEKLQNPLERIQNYLDRFKEVVERKDEASRERGLNALKKILHDQYLIKPENIPESYFELQQQIARELGHGTIEITPALRKEAISVIRADQEASLDEWIDYLASPDAVYPDWAKYWAFRSMLDMSLYDQEKKRFGHRTKDTTAKFPDLNPEALAYAVDAIEKKLTKQDISNPVQRGQNQFANEDKLVSDEEFQKLLNTESFSKYYAFAIEHAVADNAELFKITDGEWRVFKKDSDAKALTASLQGRSTGWCTAGESTARTQLRMGDFFVYFSKNALGVADIPRLAIRMYGNRIAEVRGVAHKQDIDPYIAPVLEKRLESFGREGDSYRQKAADMKRLTEVERKVKENEPLSKNDLLFLYETKRLIQGFAQGQGRDPRVGEIRSQRDHMADLNTVLGIGDQKISESEFLNKALELDSEVLGKFLLPSYVTWGNSSTYKEKGEEFIREYVKKINPLPIETKEALARSGYIKLIYDSHQSWSKTESDRIFAALADHESHNSSVYVRKLFRNHYGERNRTEAMDFINRQLQRKNYKAVSYIISELHNLPSSIANKLANHGYGKEVAENLDHFSSGLHSKIAMALIKSREISKLADNLERFRDLNYKVWEELNVANYFQAIDRNRDSFDEEVRERYF